MVRVRKPSAKELERTISDIMENGDLDHLTTKKIRILCEQKFNVNLTSRKREIDRIVMDFVNKKSGKASNAGKKKNESSGEESGSDESGDDSSSSSGSSDSESCSDSECSDEESEAETQVEEAPKKAKAAPKAQPPPKKAQVAVKRAKITPAKNVAQPAKKKASASPPPPKKVKSSSASKSAEMDDAAYARQLQAEEWNFRQRTVRKLFRDTPHKKSNSDQSKKKKSSAFMKKCLLSPALAEVIGTNEMSRPDVVQKMWSVVRERNLFDESNKQYAFCDDQLREIFGKKRIRLIGMMKYLKKHIKDIR